MTDLDLALERISAENRAALVGYWPAGFPTKELSIRAIETMISAGVDMIEVGVPYSDPVMDGPTIQAAAITALDAGSKVSDVFEVVAASVAAGAPTVVMSYWNIIERRGVATFAEELAAAGGSGIITPDLTPDEAEQWFTASESTGLNRIFLVAPSSSDDRLVMTAESASGFIYATAVMGVTGQREQSSDLAPALVARLREVTDKPVGVGLGVSNRSQAHEIAQFADAVIVGSAFIKCLQDCDPQEGLARLADLAGELRAGMERS